jgi:hypothetical protein
MKKRKSDNVPSDRKLSADIERVAQRVYDLRDSLPSIDEKEWEEMDRIARRLSRLGARYGQ